jgi:hypothetical protein
VRYDELTSTKTQGRRLGQAYLAQLPFTAVVRNQIRRRVKELRGRRWRRRCGEGEGPKEQRVARAGIERAFICKCRETGWAQSSTPFVEVCLSGPM